MVRRTKGEKIFSVINILIMLIVIFITIYPMLHVFFASISDPARFAKHRGVMLHPLGFSLKSYEFVFKTPSIKTGYANTLFLVVVGTAINIFLTVLCAYVLSRKHFYLRRVFMIFITFTMFFSGGLIPLYLVVQKLNLFNSLFSLILPFSISTFNMIIVRTYFEGIPPALEESAKIDGANDIVILFKIFLPIAIPSIAVIGLYYAVNHWNSWFYANCFITDRTKFPLQLILRQILILNSMNDVATGGQGLGEMDIAESIKHATVIIATLPILCLYPFLQKYFVKGMTVGSVKG